MTLAELTEIISTADKKSIKRELKRLGYTDCAVHKQYKHISLVDLFKADAQETDEYLNAKGKLTFQGGIITSVKGFEQLEFVLININDNKHIFPIELLIYSINKQIMNN